MFPPGQAEAVVPAGIAFQAFEGFRKCWQTNEAAPCPGVDCFETRQLQQGTPCGLVSLPLAHRHPEGWSARPR